MMMNLGAYEKLGIKKIEICAEVQSKFKANY